MGRTIQNICIGWLDLGEEDQRRAKEYLAQYNADNTLDELGFGILRDALADMFFPATNTLMTRTRYLVFIPALCLAVEQERLTGDAADRRLTDLENKLRESLRRKETTGVIGDRAKEALTRYPSSIYWGALRRLGIFLHPNWGLTYYQSHLAEFYGAMSVQKDDDGLSHLDNPDRRNWDKGFSDMLASRHHSLVSDGALPGTLSFRMTRQEARYLHGKFQALAAKEDRPSLISHMLAHRYADEFRYPWDVPSPPALARYVSHARCFSMLVQGATLQYFHLLQREREIRKIAQPTCDLTGCFEQWWLATHRELKGWQVDEFLALAANINALRRGSDGVFIKSWLKLNVEASRPQRMLESQEAHVLVQHRERTTRPHKSRLRHPEYLQRWTPPEQPEIEGMLQDPDKLRYRLDYRAWIGSTFVQDMMDGLVGAS